MLLYWRGTRNILVYVCVYMENHAIMQREIFRALNNTKGCSSKNYLSFGDNEHIFRVEKSNLHAKYSFHAAITISTFLLCDLNCL